uniref:Uncharacterized protein n=1 Tax=Lepeophtheirus salmonis TaxID=72036 RepID=A0A0K2V2X8_LEPSM
MKVSFDEERAAMYPNYNHNSFRKRLAVRPMAGEYNISI